MKKFFFLLCMFMGSPGHSQIPRPDHVVIIFFQNKGYSQILGSSSAPYINSLLNDENSALFSQSYALTHPSQPNYLMFFSGSDQGVTSDDVPQSTPFTSCNLGASLLAAGFSFKGYSESMPYEGYLGEATSLYYRKHNPWSDWQGSGANQMPASCNQPFSAFPSDYRQLPRVSIVVPNIINCMHDGTISDGDNWFKNNLQTYVNWTKYNNSLLIVTFDEDNNQESNHIFTMFYGPMVKHGTYQQHIDHYHVLRLLEDMYGVQYCANSAGAASIDYVWKRSDVALKENEVHENSVHIWPQPCANELHLSSDIFKDGKEIILNDLSGRLVQETISRTEEVELNTSALEKGLYILTVKGTPVKRKILVE